MNYTIDALSLIADEQRYFCVFVLIELVDLCLQNLEIIRVELVDQQNEGCLGVHDELVRLSACVDHLSKLIKMLDSDVQHLLRIASLNHLLLDAHQHEIKQLGHRTLIQSHNT